MSYEVYGTQGQGGSEHPDETFPMLEEALAFVKTHKDHRVLSRFRTR